MAKLTNNSDIRVTNNVLKRIFEPHETVELSDEEAARAANQVFVVGEGDPIQAEAQALLNAEPEHQG